MTTIVNIGRNFSPNHPTLANVPMLDSSWQNFIDGVKSALATQGGKDIHVFTGYSRYNGVGEDSASIQVFDDDNLNLRTLRLYLAQIAVAYAQDSIALTVAETEFVS